MSLLRALGALSLSAALAACARPPPLVAAAAPTLHLEILDAETGVRRLTVSGLPADDPVATLAGPFGLLVQPKGGGRALYVELSAEVRGERLWVHSVVTRLDDEGTLPAVFELRSKERGLALCAFGPCPAGLTRASIDAAEAALPRVHSLAGVPLTGPLEWRLQKTLLLDDSLGMETVIHDAALSSAFALLTRAGREAGLDTADSRQRLAQDTFAQLGFGLLDLSGVGPTGGQARTPMSHYGKMLRMASGADFAGPQSYFDAGYAAAAAAFVHGRPVETFSGVIRACQALGADVGLHDIVEQAPKVLYRSPGVGSHREDAPCERDAETSVDEPAILAALAGLDFAGNEEGLVPRFGVVLTHHFANFYNRISFEFVRRMQDSGMLEAAEDLLREAGLRCAFHTFGGIMSSPEWDAVVRPQCRTQIDWVHGMTAVVNALGWGTWRVRSVSSDRLVMRIYDDYESSGYEGMYGQSDRPISYLAEGAVAGLMNLVFVGNIHEKPVLDYDFYARVFESPQRFSSTVNSCMARGEGYTEITASR